MSKVDITITVDKKKWLQAIADGWKERFNEEISVKDIQGLGTAGEAVWALGHIDIEDEDIELMEY